MVPFNSQLSKTIPISFYFRKLLVVAYLMLLRSSTSTQVLWNVITESASSGVETSLESEVGSPKYFSLSTGSTYIFQLSTQPTVTDGPTAYFFKANVDLPLSMGYSSSSGLSSISTATITESKRMFLGGVGGDGTLQRHTLSYSTATSQYSLTSWNRPWLISSLHKLIMSPTSTYIFLLQSTTSNLFKWDMVSLPPLVGTSMSVGKSFSGQIYNGGYILLAGHETPDMVVIDMASMAVERYISGGLKTLTFIVDAQSTDTLFIARSDSGYGVLKLDIQSSNYITLATTAGTCRGDILQFGTLPFVGFTRIDLADKPFQLFSKSSLALVATNVFRGVGVPGYVELSMASGPVQNDKYHVAYQIDSTGWNYNSAFLEFDQCTVRDPGTSVCPACNTGYYLDSLSSPDNKCIEEFRGTTATDSSKVDRCSVTNCLECPGNVTGCRKCEQTPTRYYVYENTCTATSPPARYGVSTDGNSYLPCTDANCLDCHSLHTECSACDSALGWFLLADNHTCLLRDNFPAGMGINQLTMEVVGCLSSGCKNCKEDHMVCVACDTEGGWYRNESACVNSAQILAGFGIDTSQLMIKKCDTIGCQNCSANHLICTRCAQTDGYRLVANKCKRAIEMRMELLESTHLRLRISLKLREAMSDSQQDRQLKTLIQANASFLVSIISAANDHSVSGSVITKKVVNKDNGLELDITLLQPLLKPKYIVRIGLETPVGFVGPSQEYEVWSEEHQLGVELESVSDTQDVLTTLAAPGDVNSATGGAIILGAMALDPTGTVFRFTKVLQVINKLYYINVNFGPKLEFFLVQTATTAQDSKRFQLTHSLNFRGKLTTSRVPLSTFHDSIFWKTSAYWFTWGLKFLLLLRRKLWPDQGARKWMLYMCYNTNRLHVLVFNLVYADYVWIVPRTLLHSRGLGVLENLVARVTATLLCLDLGMIFVDLLETSRWIYLYKVLRPNYVDSKEPLETASTNNLQLGDLKPTRQINYERTYRDIDYNVHLMDMFAATQSLTKETMSSGLVKSLTFGIWVRPIILQLMISSTQNLQKFGLGVFLLQEIVRLTANVYAYIRYKHLNNIVSMMTEVSQGLFMISFSLLAGIFSFNSSTSNPPELHQTVGIWIVIGSCAAEYLLLISFLLILLVRYVREKLRIKRLGLKERPVSFIKYYPAILEGGPSPGMTRASPVKLAATPVCFSRVYGKPLLKMTPLMVPRSMKTPNSNHPYLLESAKSTERELGVKRESSNFVKVFESPYVKMSAASVLSIGDRKDKKTPKQLLFSQRNSDLRLRQLQYC